MSNPTIKHITLLLFALLAQASTFACPNYPVPGSNLQVNTDNVIVNMEMESIYDPALIADIGKIEETIDNLTTLFENPLDTIPVTGDIGTIYINGEGEVIVVEVNDDGTTTEKVISTDVDDVEGTLIKDEASLEYIVSKYGNAMGFSYVKLFSL